MDSARPDAATPGRQITALVEMALRAGGAATPEMRAVVEAEMAGEGTVEMVVAVEAEEAVAGKPQKPRDRINQRFMASEAKGFKTP